MILRKGLYWCLIFVLISLGVKAQSSIEKIEADVKSLEGIERVDALNQLTYHYISVDNQKAFDFNNEAIQLSETIKYKKGEAWAYCYRGVYEYLSGQLSTGHRDLNIALRKAKALGDKNLQGYILLQLGNCSLEEVQTDSASYFLKAGYKILKDSTDPITLSKIYRNLSALYGQLNQPDSQQYFLNRSIAVRKLLKDKTLLVEVLLLKANVLIRQGNIGEAQRVISEVESSIGTDINNEENRFDLIHLKALLFFHEGNIVDAIVHLDSARNYYVRVGLLRKSITSLIDLAKLFSNRGEYELALNNLYEGLRVSNLQQFEVESALIRNEIGWVNFHLGAYDEAIKLAEESIKIGGNKLSAVKANSFILKGVTLTNLKKYDSARWALLESQKINEQLRDKHGISEALMNLGFLETKVGHYNQALKILDESAHIAQDAHYNYGLCWSYWCMAEVYSNTGNYVQSDLYINKALNMAETMGIAEVIILSYNTKRDILKSQKRFEEALRYSVMANELNDSIHRTELTRRFINLEKIQAIEQRDRNIESLQKDKLLSENKIQLQEATLRQQSTLIIAGVSVIALLGLLLAIYYRFYSRIRSLNISITEKNEHIQSQSNQLIEINKELNELYKEVTDQKEQIQAQAEELQLSNDNINAINRRLEKLVEEKTVELRRANEELIKHNSELLQFSYTVSHNLRAPVARLLGLSSIVSNEQELDQAKQWIHLIEKTTNELDQVIRDLSDLLDIRNTPNKHREPIDLRQEWEKSLSLLKDSLDGSEEIKADFSSLPEVYAIRPIIHSIFYNLLSNAIKFKSPERGLKISIVTMIDQDRAVIEITDNGLGIDMDRYKDKIFKLYKRFHTHVSGRGLGLYLIKSQLEILHGSIELISEPDKGSTFRIDLPLKIDEPIGIIQYDN